MRKLLAITPWDIEPTQEVDLSLDVMKMHEDYRCKTKLVSENEI